MLLVRGELGRTPRDIPPGKELVAATRPIELLALSAVIDTPTDGDVDFLSQDTIVLTQLLEVPSSSSEKEQNKHGSEALKRHNQGMRHLNFSSKQACRQ